jgi:malonyl-CoA/methylmalonyl-CoA synthetase
MDANLFAIIRERIASQANILLRTAAGELVTHGDMLERSGRLANTLVLRGVEPGDRVAVQVGNVVLEQSACPCLVRSCASPTRRAVGG